MTLHVTETPHAGFGNVGLGVCGPVDPHRRRPDLCADHDHPGQTYNPWMDQTWCLCGEVRTAGNRVDLPLATTCGGPLVTCLHDELRAA